MCGIFGIVYGDDSASIDNDRLLASAENLRHRGPDATGTYQGPGVGLVHTRLSLVDLSERSNQPFYDPTRRYVLIYNGEVYNFPELRRELEREGVRFGTTSDTEVVLHALIRWGAERALPRFGGMFALALHDTQTRETILARDRFGMKPLYLYDDGKRVAFASEVKALQPWVDLEAEPFSISAYLLGFGGPTKGFTFYKHVHGVAPGGYIKINARAEVEELMFFELADFVDAATVDRLARMNGRQTVDHFEQLMWESVKRHMFADSKVGAFCSGGVDSSLLMTMAAKQHSNLAVFHANVKGSWSEYDAAASLAKHVKLDLVHVDVHEQDFVHYMPDVMRQYEHPYTYHPNCAPFMLVSRLVREHGVKGMLSGEGSDELFLGYPWLGRKAVTDVYYKGIDTARNVVRAVPAVGRIAWPYDGDRANVVKRLLSRGEVAGDERRTRETVDARLPKGAQDGMLTSLDYLNYHLRTLLHRNDSLGMEASIEARFPFLDHDVVHNAINMPTKYKLHFSPTVFEKAHPFVRDKWVVREVADRWMPKQLSQRIKIGFWTTVFERMQVSERYFDRSEARDLLGVSKANMHDIFGSADQDLRMRLLHLDVWARVCLRGETNDQVRDNLKQHVTIRPE